MDQGLLLGDGAFDTLHVVRGVPVGLPQHLDRLLATLAFLRLPPPVGGRAALEAACRGVIARNGLDRPGASEASLRITVTAGTAPAAGSTCLVMARTVPALHELRRRRGVRLLTAPVVGTGGEMARHKTTSRAGNALVGRWLRDQDAAEAEALMVDRDGRVLEGTWSNVFIVEGGAVRTPPLALGLLPGTARARVLRLAAAAGLDAAEAEFTPERLGAADEAFITASTLHVAPVVSLDGAPIGGGGPGPVVTRLQHLFEAEIEAEVAAP